VEFCDRPQNPPKLGDFEIGGMPCSQEMVGNGVFFWAIPFRERYAIGGKFGINSSEYDLERIP
jgi:hypothetical protein